MEITAIDMDKRAIQFAESRRGHLPIRFHTRHTLDLIDKNQKFDVVISNHVLHHLSEGEIGMLLDHSEQLATRKVLINDIERSRLAYSIFSAATRLFFQESFIREDGMTSIRRSFKKAELKPLVPNHWEVSRPCLFRLLLKLDKK